MSKNALRYSDTKLIKTKKPKSKKHGLFVFCLLCVLLVIFFATGLGDALKVNSFPFLFKGETLTISEHNYYAVLMGEYQTKSEAQGVASGVSVLGAGAYVWEVNNKFLVVGNVYKTKSDAEAVLKNISGNNYNVSVMEIKYNKLTIKSDKLEDEQEAELLNAVKFLDGLYNSVYDYSIKFDKSEIVATVVSSELNTIKGELKVWASKLDAINSYAVTNQGLAIKNTFVTLIEELDACVLKVINGTSVNKDLKYLVTSVAVEKYNLYNNLKTL